MFGVRLIFSLYALRDTERRLFPASRHRSARIRKKLIKRYGGESAREPCIFSLPDGSIIAHPSFEAELGRKLA